MTTAEINVMSFTESFLTAKRPVNLATWLMHMVSQCIDAIELPFLNNIPYNQGGSACISFDNRKSYKPELQLYNIHTSKETMGER